MSGVQVEVMDRLQRRCEELENQLAKERLDSKKATDDKLKAEEENQHLRVEVIQLTEKVGKLSAELERRRISTASGSSDDEHMRLLEEQVRQFQFDFESERRDCQLAKVRANDLLQQLTAAKKELQQMNLETIQSVSERREAALQYYRDEYDSCHRADSAHLSSDLHGLDLVPDGEGYDEIDYRSGVEPDITSNTRSGIMSPDVTNFIPK